MLLPLAVVDPWLRRKLPENQTPVRWIPKYKLDAVMEDATGTMNVMIFDDKAQEILGVAADELAEKEVTDDEISASVGSGPTRAFALAFENRCFVVKCILSDDMLQRCSSTQVSAADSGDLSSQEEGSSASFYSYSPKVNKKEEMMVKEDRESKRLKTEDEDEQIDTD